jgi:hypothetical protein
MNFPVSFLPSESVVLISFPRRKDFVYSKDFFRRSFIDVSSDEAGGSDGGGAGSSSFVVVVVYVAIAIAAVAVDCRSSRWGFYRVHW